MIINFVLPPPLNRPSGGHKIIFQYADGLSSRGHKVNILFPSKLPFNRWSIKGLLSKLKNIKYNLHENLSWFSFEHPVNLKLIRSIREDCMPDADVIIATWWKTAYAISSLPVRKGRKFYFVQGCETWFGSDELVKNSYKLGLNMIVVSSYIKNVILQYDGEVKTVIPNGINLEEFKIRIPIKDRTQHSVLMMYHSVKIKGSEDGINALIKAKEIIPDLKVTLFSSFKRPKWIPDWMTYIQKPGREELVWLYNQSAVFLSTSLSEGFGLTGAEALACGCALVITDSGGVKEYAIDNETALLCSPGDVANITGNLCKLLINPELRVSIAERGHEFIKDLNLDKSVDLFEYHLKYD